MDFILVAVVFLLLGVGITLIAQLSISTGLLGRKQQQAGNGKTGLMQLQQKGQVP